MTMKHNAINLIGLLACSFLFSTICSFYFDETRLKQLHYYDHCIPPLKKH